MKLNPPGNSQTTGRRLALIAVLAITFSVNACAHDADVAPYDEPVESVRSFDGGEDIAGVEELALPLTALATPCVYDAVTKSATVTLAAGEIGVISKRTVDSALLVNGYACDAARANTVKLIAVQGSAGDETVILDYIYGDFAKGSNAGAGVTVDLGGGTGDAFKIRGKSIGDTITFGDEGVSINADSSKDIDVSNVESFVVSLGDGSDRFSGQGGSGSGANPFAGVLTVYGGEGADVITGGLNADVLNGGPGDDTLAGAGGNDQLNGDEDDDTFDEGTLANGSDTFDGGLGTDIVDYSGRTDVLTVTMGTGADDGDPLAVENDDLTGTVEGVIGGSNNDTLTGGFGDDIIDGGPGDDIITGGAGADTLEGGDGDDIFDEEAVDTGADVVSGGEGIDVVDYSARTNDLVISIDNVANDGESAEADNLRNDVENIIGGSGDDQITGSRYDNVLTGGPGADTLDGGAGDDTFQEESANSGADVFIGGTGTDTVDYSSRTGDITVTMDGTAADDGEAGEGDDVQDDVEDLICGAGNDTVTGNDQANTIEGGSGNDIISGGDGDDTLYGDVGNDTINGDAGDDLVDGGTGTDTLDCGAGQGDIAMQAGGTDCEL